MEDFAAAVEDGLKLSKRLAATAPPPPPPPTAGGVGGPLPHQSMDRSTSAASTTTLWVHQRSLLLPSSPMAYAVIYDPKIVDSPDVPSYQPHVHGRCDPPALIPLQMREVAVEGDCALGSAVLSVTCRWWVHCVTRSKATDVRILLPMGEQGSILGVEVSVGKKSYTSQVIEGEDQTMGKIAKTDGGGFLKPQLFSLTISQVDGGSDVFATIRWTQKLVYNNGQFSLEIPFHFPYFVNPSLKVHLKKEKIQLTVHSGAAKEIVLKGSSHPLKEKSRQAGKLFFFHEAVLEKWSNKDFHFSYGVHSNDLFGGVLLLPPPVDDNDKRERFCLFLYPGNNINKKVFSKAVVFIIDTSASMEGKPLEKIKNAVSTALSDLGEGDYFNIIGFNDELHSFAPCLEKVNEKTVENAIQWMENNLVAQGGTDFLNPLNEGVGLLAGMQNVLPQIFFITDGSIDEERNVCNKISTLLTSRGHLSPRICTFGLGSFCNHYFLRMLASVGKGSYDAAYDSDSIEIRILEWFRKASSTVLVDICVDAFSQLDEFEVFPHYFPDLSLGSPLCVSGRFQGKLPDVIKAKGYLADMQEIILDLKVEKKTEMPIEKVFVKQQIDCLTAHAWLSESKQLEAKVKELSLRNSIPSEYMYTVLRQNVSEKADAVQVKRASKKPNAEDRAVLIQGLAVGFGDRGATREGLPAGFGVTKRPEVPEIVSRAVGCCNRCMDCCCCPCGISFCSKMNDQCAVVLTQLCTVLSCLGCIECCTFCCGQSE